MLTSIWQVRQGGEGRTDRRQLLPCLALVCWLVKQEHRYHSTPSAVLANRLLHPSNSSIYQAYFERRSETDSACHAESVCVCLRVLWLQSGDGDLSEVQEQRESSYDHHQNSDDNGSLSELALLQAGTSLSHVHRVYLLCTL